MNIGYLADKIPYKTRRGWGVYSYQLLKALIEIDEVNYYRCFYNIFGRRRRAFVLETGKGNLQNLVWPIPGRILELLWDRWKLIAAEQFFGNIDILHVPYEFLPRVKLARTVVTVHDVTFLKHPEYQWPAFTKLLTRRLRYVTQEANIIIAVSHNTKSELIEFTGVPERRVKVVPEGVGDAFKPIEDIAIIEQVTHRYGIEGPYVLFVGAADEDKNLVRLTQAFARVRKEQRQRLQLVFAGRFEWGYKQLIEKLQTMDLTKDVVITGYVSAADLPALYAGAKILALPSIHEGFGLPILEAMACGTAVLCTNVSSLPEVVGDAGILVDPYSIESIANGLHSLLVDDDLCSLCRAKGIQRAQRFTWGATAAKMVAIYRELLV